MLILGIEECLLCCEVVNIEPHHSTLHINTLQSFGTPPLEKDSGGASGQRGASIKVLGSVQLVWSCATSSPACTSQC